MWTVYKCVLPDGKVFVGKTKRNLRTHIEMLVKQAGKKQDSAFLFHLNKAKGNAHWLDCGQFLLTSEALAYEAELIRVNRSTEREFGYNYKNQNGTNWSLKGNSMEKASISRLKQRFTNLSRNIQDEKLRKRIDSLVNDLEVYMKKVKDSKE